MPNQAHLHLLLNHFPVIGLTFSLIIAIYALVRSSLEGLRISWLISIISGFLALPAYLTGGGAAHILKKFSDVNREAIGPHADMAEIGLYIALAGACFALIVLVVSYFKENLPSGLKLGILAFQLVSVGVLGYASLLGGHIRHVEIMHETPTVIAEPNEIKVPEHPVEEPHAK